MEKKSLSDKIITADGLHHEVKVCIAQDVQEAIKEFIGEMSDNAVLNQGKDIMQIAKEKFGERLI